MVTDINVVIIFAISCSIYFAAVAENPKEGDSAECVLCEFVMKQLDDLLEQNSTQV